MYLSVVISTYNGSKYILEQLDSIRNQTRRADEVMIIDDCSTDDTVEKINNFYKILQDENENLKFELFKRGIKIWMNHNEKELNYNL